MKTKLYIITSALIIAFICEMIYQSFDFMEGYKDGTERYEEGFEPFTAVLIPDKTHQTYFLENLQNNHLLPTYIRKCTFNLKKTSGFCLYEKLNKIVAISSFIAFFVFIHTFAKVVIAINKNRIFEWENVKRLRRIGYCFLILAFADLSFSFYNYLITTSLIELEGYKISMIRLLDGSSLIIGIVSFIIAEIFAIGLRLREEEELTI